MHDYPPQTEAFVENLIYALFDSIRTSRQMEDRYQPLSPKIKGLTTKQLREKARIAAQHLLANVTSIEALADIENNTRLREALHYALNPDD